MMRDYTVQYASSVHICMCGRGDQRRKSRGDCRTWSCLFRHDTRRGEKALKMA
jgi:hypothetical protein